MLGGVSTLNRQAPDSGPAPWGGSCRCCQTVTPASVSEKQGDLSGKTDAGRYFEGERAQEPPLWSPFLIPAWLGARFSSGPRAGTASSAKPSGGQLNTTVHVNTDSPSLPPLKQSSRQSRLILQPLRNFASSVFFRGAELLFGL